jgi:hypothetical protein
MTHCVSSGPCADVLRIWPALTVLAAHRERLAGMVPRVHLQWN